MSETRSTERTRRALLDAATAAVVKAGTGMSLASVAAAAGVSKGALMHHFKSREQLLLAVAVDANDRFRADVIALLDLSENYPGKMLRAYVRAICGGSAEAAQTFASAPTWNGLYEIPAVAAVMEADAAWWTEQFAQDGLDPDQILVVRRAAEGLAAAAGYGEENPDAVYRARNLLLRLTRPGAFDTAVSTSDG